MMLLALGLGSQFGTMEGVITNMFDMNIRVRKEILTGGSGVRKEILTGGSDVRKEILAGGSGVRVEILTGESGADRTALIQSQSLQLG